MDTTAIIVAAIGGLGGGAALVTAIKGVFEYIDKRKGNTLESRIEKSVETATQPILDKLDEQSEKIDSIEKHNSGQDIQLKQIYLDTTRTQLYFKMEHDTHNHDTIIKIAYRYFIELEGDWVATSDFLAWAEKENIKIPRPILDAIAKNEHHN